MSVLAVLVASFLVAVFGTIPHQSILQGLPIGILISYALVLFGALEFRSRRFGRPAFPVFLGIWIFVFSQDWTADKLIPSNELGLTWSYGAILLAAIVALWPRLKFQR
jgi:FtsH-binding integral membrane protein